MVGITEDSEERIALIASGCNISQTQAEKRYEQMTKVNPFLGLEARAKQRRADNRMRKYGIDLKTKSAGES